MFYNHEYKQTQLSSRIDDLKFSSMKTLLAYWMWLEEVRLRCVINIRKTACDKINVTRWFSAFLHTLNAVLGWIGSTALPQLCLYRKFHTSCLCWFQFIFKTCILYWIHVEHMDTRKRCRRPVEKKGATNKQKNVVQTTYSVGMWTSSEKLYLL